MIASGLQMGIVVAVYPQGNSVDVVLPDSGSRLSNVQVMVSSGSDATGTIDLPDPGLPIDDTRWDLSKTPTRKVNAIIGSYGGRPVCLGFLIPQICQMTFADPGRKVTRHGSDVYTTTDQFGNTELYHPSGTYFRIGTSNVHEDLTGQDYDQQWAIANNTQTAVHVHLTVANAGVVKFQMDIDPTGALTVTAQSVAVTTQGNASITANGNMTLSTPSGTINLNGVSIDHNGNTTTSGEITAKGIPLSTHKTLGVTSGTSESGLPSAT